MRKKVDLAHIRAVLFDLDGTLLQVRMSLFIPRYVAGVAEYFSGHAEPERFRSVFLEGVRALIAEPEGESTNEMRLLRFLNEQLGIEADFFRAQMEQYRQQRVEDLAEMTAPIPAAAELVDLCRRLGQKIVLATNPVFPLFMVDARRRWSGLEEVCFDHVTSYENSRYCKPSLHYYREVAAAIGIAPEQCLMVGNDSNHDLAAMGAGMTTYLVDTYLVERPGRRWPSDYRGNHLELLSFLQEHLPGRG